MKLPKKCVVDTNVPIVANLAIQPDPGSDVPDACVKACVEAVEHVRVDVFAGLAGVDADGHAAVVCRGNQHRVEIFVLQESAIILVNSPLGLLGFGGIVAAFDEAVGNGNHSATVGQLVDQESGAAAHADHPDGKSFVGPRLVRRAQDAGRDEVWQRESSRHERCGSNGELTS